MSNYFPSLRYPQMRRATHGHMEPGGVGRLSSITREMVERWDADETEIRRAASEGICRAWAIGDICDSGQYSGVD